MSIAEICNKMSGTGKESHGRKKRSAGAAGKRKRQESVLHFRRISDWKAAVKQPD